VARRLGFRATEPALIQETNNTVVWLGPDPVIAKVHAALLRCGVALPSFQAGLERARRALSDDRQMSALRETDRTLLRRAFAALTDALASRDFSERPLHGEPHDGNYLLTQPGLRWIDFEAACRGPVEWDLAVLSSDVCAAFPDVDLELLELLRILNSARVATWCWSRYQLPEMRWHERHHLSVVRRSWRNYVHRPQTVRPGD